MDAFEKIISDALRFIDVNDPKKRMKVYQNVAKAIESVPEQKRELYKSKLSAFIRKFEADLLAGKAPHREPAQAPFVGNAESIDEPVIDRPHVEVRQPDNGQPPESGQASDTVSLEIDEKPEPSAKPKQNRNGRFIWVLLLALLAIIAAIAYFLFGTGGNFPLLNTAQNTTAQEVSGETPVTSQAEGELDDPINTIFDISLPEDLSSVSEKLRDEFNGVEKFSGLIKDGKFIIDKSTIFFPGPEILIDPSKTYLMKLRLERTPDALANLILHAGFVIMGENNQILKSNPGPHRYFVYSGRVTGSVFTANGDNLEISGSITGTGEDALDKFLPGTKTARAIVLLRPRDNFSVSVKSVSLIEIE